MREKLAEFAHCQWSGWMKYLFEKCEIGHNGTMIIPAWAVARWTRQMNSKYNELCELEKDSDRKEADGMIDVIKS
jgi:hypothetical protein